MASSRTTLPLEVVQLIVEDLHFSNDKRTLAACTLANRTLYHFVMPLLYHTLQISTPLRYLHFSETASASNDSSWHMSLVRELDFSGYTTFGTRCANAARIVNPKTLMSIFSACVGIERIVMAESIEKAITSDVLKTIMFTCRQLKSLEFMGMSSQNFSQSMSELMSALDASIPASPSLQRRNSIEDLNKEDPIPSDFVETPQWTSQPKFPTNVPITMPKNLQNLVLHHCPLSDSNILQPLLEHLPRGILTHLDLTNTNLTDYTLLANVDLGVALTHLSLSKCKNLSVEAMAHFISGCPRLETLNLYSDSNVIFSEEDLFQILVSLPTTIRHIDIGNTQCTETILRAIAKFTPHLEKLGIAGANVSLKALERFFTNKDLFTGLVLTDLSNIPALNTATPVQLASFFTTLKAKSGLHAIELSKEVRDRIDGYTKETSGRRTWIQLRDSLELCHSLLERKIIIEREWRGARALMSSTEKYYSFLV